MDTNNLWFGEFPVAASLIMLAVDFVLYGLIALYFDNIIAGWYINVQEHSITLPS